MMNLKSVLIKLNLNVALLNVKSYTDKEENDIIYLWYVDEDKLTKLSFINSIIALFGKMDNKIVEGKTRG